MIVEPPGVEDATGHVAAMYDADLQRDGFVFSYTAAMAINPEAHEAFMALMRAVTPSIGLRVFELATLGAARGIPSPHCLLAHGRKSLEAGLLDAVQLARLASDFDSAGLSEADVAVLVYSERLSTDPTGMTDADSLALREVGFSDRQIVDITLAAAVRNYFSRALQALNVPVETVPGLDESVAQALLARCSTDGDSRERIRGTL